MSGTRRFSLTKEATNMNLPKLGWQKWKDPFFPKCEDMEDDYEEDSFYEDEDNSQPLPSNMKVVVTPMGAIPLVEQSSPNKVFNLWIAHTNFTITPEVARTVEDTEGVETLDIFSRYRMRIGIGKMFNTQHTIRQINTNLLQILSPPGSGNNV